MLLLLRQAAGVLGAGACTITLSAPTHAIAPGAATLAAGANTVTLTAPTATVLETLGAGANTITLSAPAPTVVPGSSTVAAGATTLTLSAPSAGIGFDPSVALVYVNGTLQSYIRDSIAIEDILNEEPNTCRVSFTDTFTPTAGQSISIVVGSLANVVFAGTIVKVEQFYTGLQHNIGYHVTAQDPTWLLNRRLVTQRWTSTSASTIAAAIISGYTSGFTSTRVVAGLATVTEFECVNEPVASALSRLAAEIGGYWYVDYASDLHFFLTESTEAPSDIDDVTESGNRLVHAGDLSQIRTRVKGVGAATRVTADMAVSATSIPVGDASIFSASGGSALSGANVLTYTSKSSQDGQGAVVHGPLASPTAPSASLSTASGGVTGVVSYVKIDVTDNGESEPSSASGTVTGATVSTPSAITAAAVQHTPYGSSSYVGGSLRDYYTTYQSLSRSGSTFSFSIPGYVAVGSTVRIFASSSGSFDGAWTITAATFVAFSVTTTVTCSGISTSAPSSDVGYIQLDTSGPLTAGAYGYKTTLVSSLGETSLSSATSVTVAAFSAPTMSYSTGYASGTTGGSLTTSSTYNYYTTVSGSGGESSPSGFTLHTLTGANNAVVLSFLSGANTSGFFGPAFGDLRIDAVNLYRTRAGGTTPFLVRSFTREEVSQADYFSGSVTFTYTDTTADSDLGSLPSNNPIGAAVGLTGIPTSADARTVGVRVWRTKVGGSTYYPLTLITDGSTTYLDTTPDTQLGQNVQTTQNVYGGNAVSVTVPVGASGTTRRILGRTKAGGSIYFFCGSLGDNTTTAFTDTKTDEELGEPLATFSRRRTTAASTALRVSDCSVFPSSGWVRVGSQVLQYTGRSASSGIGNLTGIAASGQGAITAPISAESEVVVEPHLTGVSGVSYAINKGDSLALYSVRNDTAAQTALAALEGGDGIHEHSIKDTSLTSGTALDAACDAELTAFKSISKSIRFRSRDTNLRSGKTITLSLGAPVNLSGSYLIQQVTISEVGSVTNTQPLREVVAAPVRVSFQQAFRRTLQQVGV